MRKERIQLADSAQSAVMKMMDGNPGAMNFMIKLLEKGGKIDPDDFMGGLGKILLLDSYGIYGTDIYVLYSDICDASLPKTIAVLRATQMGMFSAATLQSACARQDRGGKKMIPVDDLYAKVKEQLTNFDTVTFDEI